MIPTRSFNLRIGMFNMIRKVGGLYHWQIGNCGGCFYRKAVKRSKCKAVVPYKAPKDTLLSIILGALYLTAGSASFALGIFIAAYFV